MKPRRLARAVACVSVVGGLTVAVACSKGQSDSKATSGSLRVLPGAYPAPAAPEGGLAPPSDPPSVRRGRDPFENLDVDAAPLSYTVIETVEASVIHVDPDQGVLEAARNAGAACFAGLQGGPDVRSASIQVTVVPNGSVSRTEVAGASEPLVLDCLRRIGDGLHFSANDEAAKGPLANGANGANGPASNSTSGTIRSFSINVSVTRAH
jgi:hypothetical protein